MNLAGIDTNLVVALHALLHERNVTQAAKRLGLGQSATSHALARLRRHFDDALLVKSGRGLALTERAKILIEPCATAMAELERLFAPVPAFEPQTSSRVFRIAATDNLELYVLPRLSAFLSKEAPHVAVHFQHLPKNWQEGLMQNEFELKLGRKYDVSPRLRSEDLCHDQLVCVVRRGHPMKRRLSLRQYASLSHIVVAPTDSGGGPIDDALAAAGLKRSVAISVPHFLVALFAVGLSDHVLTAPARVVAATSSLRLRSVPLPMRSSQYTLSQVWGERHDTDLGHQWLRSAVRQSLG